MHAGDVAAALALVLDSVPDPEIPAVSVTDLGIVRRIDAAGAEVVITPTYTGCPATAAITRAIRDALDAAGFADIAIRTEVSPPWSTAMITPRGHARLRAYGIAPPAAGTTATCPRCGSHDTREISRFGSTPCKAQWQCRACLEPFDRFKCH